MRNPDSHADMDPAGGDGIDVAAAGSHTDRLPPLPVFFLPRD